MMAAKPAGGFQTAKLFVKELRETFRVSEIVVNDTRISMTWSEHDEIFHAKLDSDDRTHYCGTYGWGSSPLCPAKTIELTRVEGSDPACFEGQYKEEDSEGQIRVVLDNLRVNSRKPT